MSQWRIDHPEALWLALPALLAALAAWRTLRNTDALRRAVLVALRCIVFASLILALSGLSALRQHDHLSVIAVVDISGSVRRFADMPHNAESITLGEGAPAYLRWWLRNAAEDRRPDDRFGLVVFDGRPRAVATPSTGDYSDDGFDRELAEGSNIEEALRYAQAMFPPDTARRLILLTDGNETAGSAVAAAREAAAGSAGIPVDVVPVAYRVAGEVLVERIETPPFARPDEPVTVRIVLRSIERVEGALTLTGESGPIDINGDAPGYARRITLEPGLNVELATIVLGDEPVTRLEALFEPASGTRDAIAANNRAETFIFSPRKGVVLHLDGITAGAGGGTLQRTLESAGFEVQSVVPTQLPGNPLALSAYDLVILENVPREDISLENEEFLIRYVQDLGGGLIVTGGYDALGAGGWDDTRLEELLPVELGLPEEMQIPTAAIALVLDNSNSMARPVLGTQYTQQEIANEGAALAVESMDPLDWVTVIQFNSFTSTVVELQRVGEGRDVTQAIRSISPTGGTNMGPALLRAGETLRDVEADIKHIVCLSDGQSQPADFDAIARRLQADGITVSAIAVGDGADESVMQAIAAVGGGEFYAVRNPRILPRVFVRDIRIIRRPLIRETEFVPIILPTGSLITADFATPAPLGGFVLTQPRPDPQARVLMQVPSGEPLLATWQAGLGRVAVFTSDAHDNWADQWINGPEYASLWSRLARTTARSAGTLDQELRTEIIDGRLQIRLTIAEGDQQQTVPLSIPAQVYGPDGSASSIRLRQTAPLEYTASVPAPLTGNYIVAATPRRGTEQLGLAIGGVTQNTGVEFRRLSSNIGLLQEIADASGGNILDLTDPQTADLFRRDTLTPMTSVQPLWPLLLWLSLGLFLLDAAARRLAWDSRTLRRAAAAAASLTTRSQNHSDEAGPRAVDSWRRVRSRTRAGRAADAQPPPPPGPAAPPPSKPAVQPQSDQERRRAALDILKGRGKPAPPPPPPPAADEPDPEHRSATTSGLLRRKRQLRGDSDAPDA